jgi:hypothetical protein
MKRIIHYLPEFFNTHHGVIEAIILMANIQKKTKKKFLILTNSKTPKKNKEFLRYRLSIKHMLMKKILVPLFFSLHPKIKKKDIFIIHSGFTLQNFIMSRILYYHKIKYLVWPHGVYIENNLKKNFFTYLLKRLFIFFFEKKMLQDAKYIICCFDPEKESIIKYFGLPKSKFKTIPYPINFKQYKLTKKRKNIITSVQRVDIYHKGTDIGIKAFDKSKLSLKYKYKLALGPFKDDLKKIEEIIENLNNKKNIKLLPPIYGKSKINLLKSSKLALFTSRYEAFGISLFESLWYGQECILSKDMYASGLIKKFNIAHVSKNTPNSLSKKIDLASKIKKNTSKRRAKLFAYLFQNFIKKLYNIS